MKKIKNAPQKGFILIDKSKRISEKDAVMVADKKIKFPKDLGIEHPFEFEDVEKVYCKSGFVYGAVQRYVNSIIGEFTIKSKEPKVEKLANDFVKESGLKQQIPLWIAEGIVKGNGFLYINMTDKKVRSVNANNIYVQRDDVGKVTGYNQYFGDIKKFDAKKVIPLKPNQIAHLKVNPVADSAYGNGIIYPNERVIQNIVISEQTLTTLMERKAGAPIWFKVGQPGEAVNTQAMDAIKADLQYLTNKTEWVTDGNVDIKTIDFAEVGKNITDALNHHLLMFSYGTMIPESMLGKGNLPEGLADNNTEMWKQLISAYQDQLETLLEDQVFKPYLISEGFKADLEFEWNLPTEKDINSRMTQLMGLLNNMGLDENLRRMANLEIAKLMNWEDVKQFLPQPSTTANEERKEELEKKQPEVPGEKKTAAEKVTTTLKENLNSDMDSLNLNDFCNFKEIQGFNYVDYMAKILEVTNKDDFENLVAETEKQVEMGLLIKEQIDKLRVILKDGFKNNKSINEIKASIKKELDLKDRLDENGVLMVAKEDRPQLIARTETIRLANEGLKELYIDNKIDKVRWLAALSDRTCEQCADLNGRVYEINSAPMPAVDTHPGCRCTLLSVVE